MIRWRENRIGGLARDLYQDHLGDVHSSSLVRCPEGVLDRREMQRSVLDATPNVLCVENP